MWRSTLFDICMCLYNAFTRCNNAINRVRWRYNLEMRPCVISQALACVVYSSTSIVYNYTQLFIHFPIQIRAFTFALLVFSHMPFHPPINEHPCKVFPHLPHYYYPNYFKPYCKYCLYHINFVLVIKHN
jgi:hypothetical protein